MAHAGARDTDGSRQRPYLMTFISHWAILNRINTIHQLPWMVVNVLLQTRFGEVVGFSTELVKGKIVDIEEMIDVHDDAIGRCLPTLGSSGSRRHVAAGHARHAVFSSFSAAPLTKYEIVKVET